MKFISSALLLLAPLVAGQVCDDVVNGLTNLCEIELGCSCGVPPPNSCREKGMRLVTFSSQGTDPNVALLDDGTNDAFDGGQAPIEFRFSLIDNSNHYPGNLANCGPGSSLGGEVRVLNDGQRYCSMLFGAVVNTADTSFKMVPGFDDGNAVVSFRAYESDNAVEPDHVVPIRNIQGNLVPSEWFDDTCTTYRLRVYVPYQGINRIICYEISTGENLNLAIPRCTPNLVPSNNFYTFVFEVGAVPTIA